MTKNEILEKLNKLPKGGITTRKFKKANDKIYEYYYLQWTEEGKQKSIRINDSELDIIKSQLEERRKLEELLNKGNFDDVSINLDFNTEVIIGDNLKQFSNSVNNLNKRYGYNKILDYINDNTLFNKVFVLYGLRRTGKTTLIKQIINNMNNRDLLKSAFIQITKKDTFSNFNKDLKLLQAYGYKYIFVDEITFMEDFIEGASLLSDIYASSGIKIILSGTDSLGFWITKSNELYDRCIMLHTTFIPYKEFSEVLGVKGIDNYIQYGGTMSMSGNLYNSIFSDSSSTNEYIDSAIAQNIQHSLKHYQYEGHFRHLYDLYQNNELTGAINRVVEDINHRFTIDVLEKEFKSNDLRLSQNNLRKDRLNPTTVLDDIDINSFTNRLKELLEIKNKEERKIKIDDSIVKQIQEYLKALDMIDTIDIKDIDNNNKGRIVFTQPGIRYSQAKSIIESLSNDVLFKNISIEEQERIKNRILNEIKGRMTEDIILLETKIAMPYNNIFKLQFSDGEFDMVIQYLNTLEIEIFEIKYSKEIIKEQARHLIDENKCKEVEFKFGKIRKKTVLYRGENTILDGITYQNIEDYLSNL